MRSCSARKPGKAQRAKRRHIQIHLCHPASLSQRGHFASNQPRKALAFRSGRASVTQERARTSAIQPARRQPTRTSERSHERARTLQHQRSPLPHGGISRQSFYQLLNSGELASVVLGRRRLVPAAAIHAFIATSSTHVAPAAKHTTGRHRPVQMPPALEPNPRRRGRPRKIALVR